MKKRVAVLVLLLLLTLAACRMPWERKELSVQPVDFYYLTAEDSAYGGSNRALHVEVRDLGEEACPLQEILQLYLQGPREAAARSPFPPGLTAEMQSLEDGILTVEVSEHWTSLSGVGLQLAKACVVLTMTQFPEVEFVSIRTAGGEEDGAPMAGTDFLLYDDSATNDQISVKLYFSDANGRYLLEETRSRSFDSEDELPAYILQELLQGPEQKNALPVLPEGTNLLHVELEQGVCTVDFSEAFCTNRPKTHSEARMTVFSVVNSLTELQQVESVRFLCVGAPVGDYAGLDLSKPMYREEPALERSTATSIDGTLYLPCGTEGKLAEVPTYIRQTGGRSGANAVLNVLMSFKPANGYENPFPDGSVVMDLYTVNGLCEVTFNSAFALCDADQAQAQKAVRSVVATLCALDEIDRVKILVNDTTMNSVDLSEPLRTESSWVLP